MKSFILFCVVLAAVSAEDYHLTPAQKEKVLEHTAACIKETGVSADVLAEAKKTKTLWENDGLKEFFFCFFKKTGVLSPSGELNVDVALQRLPSGFDKAAAEKLLNDCKSTPGKDPTDTAYQIFKCYFAGTNQHVIFE